MEGEGAENGTLGTASGATDPVGDDADLIDCVEEVGACEGEVADLEEEESPGWGPREKDFDSKPEENGVSPPSCSVVHVTPSTLPSRVQFCRKLFAC